MKQVIQNLRDGKTTVQEVPVPAARAGFALVRTAASLVSAGTERMLVGFAEKSLAGKARARPDLVRQVVDKARSEGPLVALQSALERLDEPMALGYSSAGTIVALGADMDDFRVGQRVACAGGNFAVHAEYAAVPRNLLTRLPDDVDFESGAFTTLAAIALHGFRLAEPQIGENVAVIGLGLLGLLTAQVAAAAGCRVLGTDLDAGRVALAASLGLQAVTRDGAEDAARAFTAQRGFDTVVICADSSSNDPVELAALIARERARVVAIGAVGQDLPRKLYYDKELSFINSRSYGPGRYDPSYEQDGHDYPIGYVRWTEGRNFEAVVELLASGRLKVEPLVTHRFPIEDAANAYELITGKGTDSYLGVLITYPKSVSSVPVSRVTYKTRDTQHPTTATVRMGVIGAGKFANATLLPALRNVPGLKLTGIASAGGLHAQHSGKKFGFEYAAGDAEQILNDADINTVAILTRNDSHAELVVRALRAGKHVFVEKPMAIDESQLETIRAQVQRQDCPLLTVGFNRRFAPLAGRLQTFLKDRHEAIYAHYRVNAGYLPPDHWVHDPRMGGGRIVGEACHFIDFIAFIVGAAPVSVSALALADAGRYHQDNVSMTFTFQDGSIGVVDYLANGDRAFPKERLEVFCGGRVAVLDDFRSLEMITDGKKKEERAGAQDKGWRAEWTAFAQAVRDGGAPPIPYDDLFGVTQAALAVADAVRTHERITLA